MHSSNFQHHSNKLRNSNSETLRQNVLEIVPSQIPHSDNITILETHVQVGTHQFSSNYTAAMHHNYTGFVPNTVKENDSEPSCTNLVPQSRRISIASLVHEKDITTFPQLQGLSTEMKNCQAEKLINLGSSNSTIPVSLAGADLKNNKNEIASKPHVCQVCQRRFHQKGGLRQHFKAVHRRIKDHVCKVNGCKNAYASEGDLSRHTDSIHLGRRPFVCKCEKSFTRLSSLTRHISSAAKGCSLPEELKKL